ncbi:MULTISPECIES: cysteine hydrolase family protein [Pseudomonas]|uniref:Isochorismatase n=1 Tax=Pseudomonas fluorescens LMG 5329 TaxID=1324332 RepID=A0A0A1YS55_PSEFL|nr:MULTISPECIES: cysteine hydrolase family protein [Pseudomonas]KGE64450.1 isochorismatase [Pseudomonas fluorescens LMG 5329]NWE05391.1 cysteine hydrolase [Pseudomonas sp. IPO3749]NWF19925.1 cysteine hydrolase [Pseudomonas sp. IPO3749]
MADALLIIDMQTGLYDGPEKPFERERVLATINLLIQRARLAGAPIFVARHTGPAGSPIEAGSPLWQLWHGLEVDESRDHLFNKTRPSCFLGTNLEAQLKAAQVNELVIVGMKTQFCIDTTCRVAVELGFSVVLPEDGHTCMDTPALKAEAIIEHHNATLAGAFVKRARAVEISF